MSTVNLHNLPEKAWERIFFFLEEDDRDIRSLLFTSREVSAHISSALHVRWERMISQRQSAAKTWKLIGGSCSQEKIVGLLQRLDFAAFFKPGAGRHFQPQASKREDYQEWLENFWNKKKKDFRRLKPLALECELDAFEKRLKDLDLFKAAIRKGDLEWFNNFDWQGMEIETIDKAALLSLDSPDYNPEIFNRLIPYTSVFQAESEEKQAQVLTEFISRAAFKERSAEFKSLIDLNRPFSYGMVLTSLVKKNSVPEIRMLLNLEGFKINKNYFAVNESPFGILSSYGLHEVLLQASLSASLEAIQEILAQFPDSIPYAILRHARDLMRAKASAKFGEEKHPIYEKGYQRLYKHLRIPAEWMRICTVPDHQKICRLLSKEIIRRFPDPTPFQDECLALRELPLNEPAVKKSAVMMINISFKK